MVDPVAFLRRLKEIFGHILPDLVGLGPFADIVEIATHVFRVEVNVCLWELCHGWLEPDLAHHTYVHRAHELLTNDVEAVC